MSNLGKSLWIPLLLAATLGASSTLLAGDEPPTAANLPAYQARALRQHFPNVLLLTQDGKKVRFYDNVIKGKIVLIQFMFANCDGYCPMVTPNLAKVQKELQKQPIKNLSIVSITVDPQHDTPEVLKEYAKRFHAQPGWQFLTGSKSDIDWIRRELGVYDPDDRKLEHMNILTIGEEPTGRWIAVQGLQRPDAIAYTVRLMAGVTEPSSPKPVTAHTQRGRATDSTPGASLPAATVDGARKGGEE